MRVLAGSLKGQRLAVPGGRATRPTGDRVRIACLDTLMPYLGRGGFLDLFAGGGGVGIEALSRGARSAVFVESDSAALRALRDNIDRLGLRAEARVMRDDAVRALSALARRGERFAVVFLDPPYASSGAADALATLGTGAVLAPDAVVALQHATKAPPPDAAGALTVWKARRFGETTLTFFRSRVD
jgi:16S rRNA (guanine966-N2)-methyltransferase